MTTLYDPSSQLKKNKEHRVAQTSMPKSLGD